MEFLVRDVQYALRGLRNAPGFTAIAVITLALGIGVNSTIFSMVNSILLKPLPVESPDELVDIYGRPTNNTDEFGTTSWLDYQAYRDQSQTLSDITAYTNFFANFAHEGRSELVVGEIVAGNFFDVLGVRPQIGRGFVAEEVQTEGTHPVVVISHGFWQSRFAGAVDVVGKPVRLNGLGYTVIGVAPADFGGMFPAGRAQMWLPLMMVEHIEPLGNQRYTGGSGGETRLERRGQRWLWMRGRRAEGVETSQVQAELLGIAGRLAAEYPDSNELETVHVIATREVHFNPGFDSTLVGAGALILGIVSLVLLVACANLANMLLARAAVRQREIAIRMAIGAARVRLVRQLLTESLTLAILGGLTGLALASWLTQLIAAFQPPLPMDFDIDLSLDWRVLVFTLGAAGLTGVIFGLVPALRASRPDLVSSLKNADSAEHGGRRLNLRDALVVVQVAVSIVLLVAGALLVRSLGAANNVDLGYDADRISFLGLAMEMNGYDGERSGAFFDTARQRLEALPGVEGVTIVSRIPLSVNDNNYGLFLDGHQSSRSDRPYLTGGQSVDEKYFDTLGLTIVRGRAFNAAEIAAEARVAVVTEAFAERYWPAASAVGEQFRTTWEGAPYEIVGVVQDYKVNTPGEADTPYLHVPLRRNSTFGNFMVRNAGAAVAAVGAQEQELRSIDPDLVFLDTGSVRKLVETRLFAVKLGAYLIGAFGLLALVLACVGLYGVIGYSVSRRTREIGIRMALGAETGRVVKLVLRQGMVLVVIGGVVGAAIAALTGQILSSVLFVSSVDPLAYAVALVVLSGVAAFANWVPARRASRVDPMISLRSE